jgi:hypothetical protein
MIGHAVIKLFVHLSAYGAIGTEISHVEATAGSARAVPIPRIRHAARAPHRSDMVTFETGC